MTATAKQAVAGAMAAEWEVRFSWRNSYGDRKRVTTFVEANSQPVAVSAARTRIAELYCIENARLIEAKGPWRV